MRRRKQRKWTLKTFLKLTLCIVAGIVLFSGGKALGKYFEYRDFSWAGVKEALSQWSMPSLSELPTLEEIYTWPVISMFVDRSEEEAASLQRMQRHETEEGEVILDGEAINILMMGIDARDPNENSRSDTMILLSVDPEEKQVALISIPRDTRIATSNGSVKKINAVNADSGPEAACKVVGNLLHTEVDHYVLLNFNSFINIVDILGGVDMDVEMDMYHEDNFNPELEIDLKKGEQHLDGRSALQYVRYRGGATADIGRTQRQQKFLKAMADKMISIGAIKKIPNLWAEVKSGIRTDLSITDMGSLAKVALALQDAEIHSQTLPGTATMIDGVSYWNVNKSAMPTLISDVRAGKTVDMGEDREVKPAKSKDDSEMDAATSPEGSIPQTEDAEISDISSIMPDNFWIEDTTVTEDGENIEEESFAEGGESPLGDMTEPAPPEKESL